MLQGFGAIVRKDLRLELRTGEGTITLMALALMILVVLVLTLGPRSADPASLAAGALWIALIFSGMLGTTRSLAAERDNGCIEGLLMSPVDPATIYAAKLAVGLLVMLVAGAAVLIMLVLFFNLEFGWGFLRVLPVFILGAVGLAAVCILLAAISGRTRAEELLLPVLVVPLFTPALIAGSKASAVLLGGGSWSGVAAWIKLLCAFDVLFVVAGYLLFEYTMLTD